MARRRPEPDLNLKTTPARRVGNNKHQLGGETPAPARRAVSAQAHQAGEAETTDLDYAPASRPARLPALFFLLVMALFVAVLVVEVRNRMLRPTVWTPPPPNGAPALTFYGKSDGASQTTWIIDEPAGEGGPPRFIQRISHTQMKETGEIRWSADGRAVYATGRGVVVRGVPVLRWFFEFGTASSTPQTAASPRASEPEGNPTQSPAGRMYVSKPELAPPGSTSFVEDPAALTARWEKHGGTGALAASWYDLGVRRPYLYSWQTTRWENVLPE